MRGNRKEYRAVYTNPQGGRSFGPVREELVAALADQPLDATETLEVLTGVEVREATPWLPVPLAEIRAVR